MLFVFFCTWSVPHTSLSQHALQSFSSLSLREAWSMPMLINGYAPCNSASWSRANGWPGSVNTFISCRLTAAAVEQETSSGMNQMKEQIIPSSPWMTCSSDPESVFASLSQSSLAQMQHRQECVCVCQRVCVFRLSPTYATLFQSLHNHCRGWVSNHRADSKHKLKVNLREWWTSALNVQYISTELKRRDTGCPPRLLFSICPCSPMCLSQKLLADLALTWPRKQNIPSPLNLTPNPFLLSASLVVPGALDLLTTIDRSANYSRTVEGMRSKKEGGL